ncbi:MAG: rod shape-determining protein MreD [Clostridia bacterium]|nr:rod shape-determining protein MreD [Clostridia bacterium]
MINYILSYLTLIVLFVVQTTLSGYIDVFGIAPNLIFVYILCYSMYNFPVRSAVLCAVAGILTDLYSQEFVGLNALLFMYIGLAMSNFASSLIKNNIWTSFLGVLLVSLVYHSALLIADYVVPGYSGFVYPFARFAVPTAVYDAVLSLVMTFWARRLSEDKIRGF